MNELGQQHKQTIDNDLSLFLKRIRQREEEHHKLCDYTNRLLARQSQLEQIIYIHDQMTKHTHFHQQSQTSSINQQKTDQQLASRCDSVLGEEEQGVLGRRVISRVLEITFAAIETFREYREFYSANYYRFKEKCLKVISSENNKTSAAVRLTSHYLHQKMNIQLNRLQKAIGCLQISNYSLFPHLKSTYYELLPKKNMYERQREDTRPILSSRKNIIKQEESHEANPEKEVKREIRVRTKTKSNHQDKEKSRRARVKKMKKIAAQLNEVMDVDKDELLDDLGPDNKEWIQKKILSYLVTRNKANQGLINEFLEKEPFFREALNHPPPKHFRLIQRCHSLEEEFLEQSESQSQLDEFKKNAFTAQDIHISENNLPKKEGFSTSRYNRRDNLKPPFSSHKKTQRKQRVTFNDLEELDGKKKQISHSQKQILHQKTIVQIQLKGTPHFPNGRFPQISHRAASVSRSKLQKVEESPLRTKLQIKPSSTYFQEVEKRIIKFCEMKKNLMV